MADLGSASTNFAVPQHPLPEEIRNMERDETICKFCGVSYLIHNEVKALQERLAEAEKQMVYYKGSVEREKVLKEKLEKMDVQLLEQSQTLKDQSQQLFLFKSDLKMKVDLIDNMYSQKRQYKSDLQDAKSKEEKLNARMAHMVAILPKLNCLVRQQKESVNTLRREVNKQQLLNGNNIDSMKYDLEKVIKKIVEKAQNERSSLEVKWKDVNEQLLKSQNDLRLLQTSGGSERSDLQKKHGELEKKLTTYQKLVDYLEEENKTCKEKTSTAEKELAAKETAARRIMNDMETLKRGDQQEFSKHQETIIRKDSEIKRLNDLCKSLERLMNEKSAAEKEVRRQSSGKDTQLKGLVESLSKAKEMSEMMTLEREQTIITHHHRIEELRESYSKKLLDSGKSYGELQRELDEQRKKLENDFEESERGLKEEFDKERDVANTRHSEQLNTVEQEVLSLNEKLEKGTRASRNLKDEINQLKNTLSTKKTNNAQEVQRYQEELLHVKAKLDDLQHRPQVQDQDIAVVTHKYHTSQKSLQDVNAQLRLLQQEQMDRKDEMLVLQDTVRQECEERLELTQALSDARMQLLSSSSSGMHRNSPPTKSNPRMLNRTGAAKRAAISRTMSNSEVSSSVVDLGFDRKIKSTGSDTPSATRESVDSFRERIAVALGRQSRANHTR